MTLDVRATDILFRIIETASGTICNQMLMDSFPGTRQQFQRDNLLKSAGLSLIAVDPDDHENDLVDVEWSEDLGSYAYFSGLSGWVTVPEEDLRVYAVDLPVFLQQLVVGLDLPPRTKHAPLIEDILWDIGDIRLKGRTRRLPTWFAKRLNVSSVQEQVADIAKRRPADGLRLLLTSTRQDRLQKIRLPGHLIVSVHDVLGRAAGLAIEPDILAARVDQVPLPDINAPIWLSPDGRKLIINGKVTVNFRSEKHITIIRRLVEGYHVGERYRAQVLLDEAQAGAMTLRKAFGDRIWAVLSPYLKSENGLWGFQP